MVGFVLGHRGRLPAIYTEIEVNYFLLRRLLGVKTADGKQVSQTSTFLRGHSVSWNGER